MREFPSRNRNRLVDVAISVIALGGAVALGGCSIDSYSNDAADVQCDGKRTMADLTAGGTTAFIVHGDDEGEVATLRLRRDETHASVAIAGQLADPLERLDEDGFNPPVSIVEGPELDVLAAGGAWIIDIRDRSAVIEGSCDGL